VEGYEKNKEHDMVSNANIQERKKNIKIVKGNL
jgi:hypothetical protein